MDEQPEDSRFQDRASVYIYIQLEKGNLRGPPYHFSSERSLRMPDIEMFLMIAVPLVFFKTEVPGGPGTSQEAGCCRICRNPGSFSLRDPCKNFGQSIAVFSKLVSIFSTFFDLARSEVQQFPRMRSLRIPVSMANMFVSFDVLVVISLPDKRAGSRDQDRERST